MTMLYGTDLSLTRARDRVVAEWRMAGYIDLIDLNSVHRDHLMNTTKAGWDRQLTIRQSTWTYEDLDVHAQARVDCVLLNRKKSGEVGHDFL